MNYCKPRVVNVHEAPVSEAETALEDARVRHERAK